MEHVKVQITRVHKGSSWHRILTEVRRSSMQKGKERKWEGEEKRQKRMRNSHKESGERLESVEAEQIYEEKRGSRLDRRGVEEHRRGSRNKMFSLHRGWVALTVASGHKNVNALSQSVESAVSLYFLQPHPEVVGRLLGPRGTWVKAPLNLLVSQLTNCHHLWTCDVTDKSHSFNSASEKVVCEQTLINLNRITCKLSQNVKKFII